MKIRLGWAEFVYADGRTSKRDKASSCFAQFCEFA